MFKDNFKLAVPVCLRQTAGSVRSYRSRIFNIVALSVPTRGLRPLERWLCQCQLAAFGRSNGGFVSANSRPSAARTVALSVPTRGLRPLERWLCQCQLAAFGRSNAGFVKKNFYMTDISTGKNRLSKKFLHDGHKHW
ncbi:hypothetical protein Ddc_16462 [Ditylenchus destructor]|nr:hypothetical protein Ddc_16462 [Ditylenchus destructor]